MRLAVVSQGLILNVIVAQEGDPVPEGIDLIPIPDGLTVDASGAWTWDGLAFIGPPPEPPEPPVDNP